MTLEDGWAVFPPKITATAVDEPPYSCRGSGLCHQSSSHPCPGQLAASAPNQSPEMAHASGTRRAIANAWPPSPRSSAGTPAKLDRSSRRAAPTATTAICNRGCHPGHGNPPASARSGRGCPNPPPPATMTGHHVALSATMALPAPMPSGDITPEPELRGMRLSSRASSTRRSLDPHRASDRSGRSRPPNGLYPPASSGSGRERDEEEDMDGGG